MLYGFSGLGRLTGSQVNWFHPPLQYTYCLIFFSRHNLYIDGSKTLWADLTGVCWCLHRAYSYGFKKTPPAGRWRRRRLHRMYFTLSPGWRCAPCRVIQCTAPSQRPRCRCTAPANYAATEGGSGGSGREPPAAAERCVAAATSAESENSICLVIYYVHDCLHITHKILDITHFANGLLIPTSGLIAFTFSRNSLLSLSRVLSW